MEIPYRSWTFGLLLHDGRAAHFSIVMVIAPALLLHPRHPGIEEDIHGELSLRVYPSNRTQEFDE